MIYVGLGRTFQPTATSGPLTQFMNLKLILKLEIFLNPRCCGWVTVPQPPPHFPGCLGFLVPSLACKERIFLPPWGLPRNIFMELIFSPSWKLLESLWRGSREKADARRAVALYLLI